MEDEPVASTDEVPIIDGGEISENDFKDYQVDPLKKQKAATARTLSIVLVTVLAISVAMHYLVTTMLLVNDKVTASEAVNRIFTMWLPVISGLVGSAVTYYFATEK